MCYKVGCDLKKLRRKDIKRIVTASGECFEYLESVGISVMPVGEDKLFKKGIMGYVTFLLYCLMSRTVLGKLMVADHARNGVAENKYIDAEFEKFRTSHPGKPMPMWDSLRKYIDRESYFSLQEEAVNIKIDFEHPHFDEKTIFELTLSDLDCFYADANEVDRLNLFFILEASLHQFQDEKNMKAAARCAFLMAYYLFTPLTPPASLELAEFYIDRAVEWDGAPEYRQWKKLIYEGN